MATDLNALAARAPSTFIVICACSFTVSTSVAPSVLGSFLSWYSARSSSTVMPNFPVFGSCLPKVATRPANSTTAKFFPRSSVSTACPGSRSRCTLAAMAFEKASTVMTPSSACEASASNFCGSKRPPVRMALSPGCLMRPARRSTAFISELTALWRMSRGELATKPMPVSAARSGPDSSRSFFPAARRSSSLMVASGASFTLPSATSAPSTAHTMSCCGTGALVFAVAAALAVGFHPVGVAAVGAVAGDLGDADSVRVGTTGGGLPVIFGRGPLRQATARRVRS